MGDLQYPTRLRWHQNIGAARHDGVTVELHAAPGGFAGCTELDFIPGVIAVIREGCEGTRDMNPAERSHAMALLIRMATEARDAVAGGSTLVVVGA